MRYQGAPQRRERILSALRTAGFLSIADLTAELGVSDMTVRRDLRLLEETGEVRTVRGGVSLRHGTLRTPDFLNRAGHQAEAKHCIAVTASRLIRDGDSIAFDAGTTTYALAAELPEDFTGSVITASVPVIQLMLNRPKARVVGLGGELIVPSQAFAGRMTEQAAAQVRTRQFFLAALAVDAQGVYVQSDTELGTKRALMSGADQVILLVDSEKFRASGPVRLCPLSALDAIVTDREPTASTRRMLREADVVLHVAPAGSSAAYSQLLKPVSSSQ